MPRFGNIEIKIRPLKLGMLVDPNNGEQVKQAMALNCTLWGGAYFNEPRCGNEISFRLYGSDEYLSEVFPKSTGLNFIRSISSSTSMGYSWRIGRNGLVNLAKDSMSHNWGIPESEKVFFAWLKDQGWEAELSPPGRLAKQIYKQLNGHVMTLANEALLGLLRTREHRRFLFSWELNPKSGVTVSASSCYTKGSVTPLLGSIK